MTTNSRDAGTALVAKWRADHRDYPESKQDCADELEALLTAEPPVEGGVPEGWKMVPVDITELMRVEFYELSRHRLTAEDAWRAMLAAAPEAPALTAAVPAQPSGDGPDIRAFRPDPTPAAQPSDAWSRLETWLGTWADSITMQAYNEMLAIQRAVQAQPIDAVAFADWLNDFAVEWLNGPAFDKAIEKRNELSLSTPAAVGGDAVRAVADELRNSLGRGATVATRRRWAQELDEATAAEQGDG